ncbi:MAG: penicillin acylase family protein [Solirubrobacteraceae bacterium]|jgi:acyl-homoserine lactone acylase PvdQ
MFGTTRSGRGGASRVRFRAVCQVSLGGLVAFALLALGAPPASATPEPEDFSGPAFQILAPGEEGGLPVNEFSTDQGVLYNKLTPMMGNVTQKALERDYLSEKFGVQGPVLRKEETGRPGLEILRDSHDIPHIFGTTRADVMFGSGWVAAEDRGLLLRLGLGPAYAAALGIPGISAFGLLLEGRSFKPSAQAVSFVSEQKKVLIEKGARGEQVLQDLENWAEGVNAYEQTLPVAERLPTVTATDAIAGFAFIGSIFGNGGGNEVANSDFLAKLQAKLGSSEGLKVFRDLREVNDPEAPTTTSKPFPYDQVPSGPTPGAVVIDPGSMSTTASAAIKATNASRRKASNFLVVGASRTRSGHPLAVMGPQLGYFYPEIVMQADLHGPGIDAEGIVAPISPYVFIGRGRDFAWSLTSAGSENTQQFLLKLCNPDKSPPTRESESYEYHGECIPMTTFDAGELGEGNGEAAHEVYFKESVYGPVSGTVTVKGQPYAIANDRATRGREPAGELAFSDLDSDRVHSPEQFFEAANELETTFSMSYLDSKQIAYFSTGRLPVLAPGTDPSLPTLGTGEYDWQGFLSLAQHPHAVAPAGELFLNWNNKPAPEWGAASDNYSYGPVHRVQLFTGFTHGMTEVDDVSIMNRAATQDLRAVEDWPVIKQVLAGGPAPSKLAEEAANIVSAWSESGASRLGLNRPNAPGAAILDAAWTPIAEAVLSPVLGAELTSVFASMNSPNNAPSSTGSAYDEGWYGYVYKDLRSELGLPVKGPYSRQYCGGGSLTACRASLWAAVQKAAEQLQASQGSNPAAWRAAKVRITFPPGLLPYTMRWTNRSTFQQVIEFTGHAPE